MTVGTLDTDSSVTHRTLMFHRFSFAEITQITHATPSGLKIENDGANNDTDPSYPAAFTHDNMISVAATDSAPAREIEKKEIDCLMIAEKLANLARRVADLPEGVPADAFYTEMKRLNDNRARIEGQIKTAKQQGAEQEIVSETQYVRLLERLKTQLEAVSPEVKRKIAQALIHKVVVTKDGFELHYFAGADQIKQGEAFASPSFLLNKKFSVLSSFKGLNGGSYRD